MAKCKLPIKIVDGEGREHEIQPFEPDVFIEDVEKYEQGMARIGNPPRDPGAVVALRTAFVGRLQGKALTTADLEAYEADLAGLRPAPQNASAETLKLRLDFIKKVLAKVPDAPTELRMRSGDIQIVFLAIWQACFKVPDAPLG